jgi:hypothetical protein
MKVAMPFSNGFTAVRVRCFEPMSASNSAVLPAAGFPRESMCTGKPNVVWCGMNRSTQARSGDFVYEISWVAELGLWRSFLRSQSKVKS